MASEKTVTRDPGSNFYIHYTRDFYNTAFKSKMAEKYNSTEIQKAYIENADYIKNRYLNSRKYLDDIEGNKKYKEEMQMILDLYASANDPNALQSELSSSIAKMSDDIVKRIKGVTGLAVGSRQSDAAVIKDIKALDKYISSMNSVLDEMIKYDKKAIGLAAESSGKTRQTIRRRAGLVNNRGALYIMSANKTGQTSLQNLARKIEALEQASAQFKAGKTSDIGNTVVKYEDASTGKMRTRKVSDLFGGIPTQLTNIQGGIGEMMAYVIAEEGVKNGILDALKNGDPDVTIEMDAGAASDVVENQLLGLKATSVSDTKIVIKGNAKSGYDASVSLGISSKAQFTKGSKEEGKSSSTSFGTTTVKGLLARAQLWDHETQYMFLNMLAPHKQGTNPDPATKSADLFKESLGMRRYIAAKAMRHMLGGLEGDKGDTVYFLKYQDAMFPVDDYFRELADIANGDIKGNLPYAGVSNRGAAKNEWLAPSNGESPEDAGYRRSIKVRSQLLNLTATVTKTL